MNQKITPIVLRAASLTLPASLAAVVGTVSTDAANSSSGAIKLGSLEVIRLVCSYTRAGATGVPVFAVDLSFDAPTTAAASVANWVPTYLLDSASFSAGAVDGYPEAFAPKPSAAGTTTRATPPWDTRAAHWCRIRMTDTDTGTPGAITSLAMGGQ